MNRLKAIVATLGITACFSLIGCGSNVVATVAAPSISAVLPQTIAAGSSSVTMKVVGTNFASNAVILWNGTKLTTSMVDATTLSGSIQGGSLAVPGTAQVQVQNIQTGQASQSVPISIISSSTTVPLPLEISTPTLSAGVVGTAYSANLAASGGSSPYSWSVTAGTLPAGLTLAANSGAITGTPTTGGTFSFTVTVNDSSSPVQTQSAVVSITIAAAPASPVLLTVTTSALASGTDGVAYSANLLAAGGTPGYIWSISSGSLPTGLALSASSGTISGTPTAAGTFTFTASVSDRSSPVQTKSATLSITITSPQLTITSSTLAAGTVGTAYSQTLHAGGGTPSYTWSVTSGSLPAGLTLAAGSGVISGTPTASGTYSFTITVGDTSSPIQTKSVATSITIVSNALTITSSALASGTDGTAYSQTLHASGGTPAYTWSISSGSLPAGLALSASSGTISGTPTASGTFTFTASVTDSSSPVQTKSVATSITIASNALTITTSSLASGTDGKAYSQSLVASGGTSPYTWSVTSGSLPAGLTLSSGGVIAGTPTASGTSTFTVSLSDSGSPVQTKSATLSITVAGPTLTITSSTLAAATVSTAYTQTLSASGGTSPYTWSITSGSLPAGLTLSAGGVITGTPTAAGTYKITITVTDSSSPAQTQSAATSLIVAAGATTTGPGQTWFVRPDGGSRFSANVPTGQCNGQYDAAYPGSGTDQNCAFSSVQYLYTDGTYGVSQWIINGGDTVVIRGCAPLPGEQNASAPDCRIGWVNSMGTGGLCQGVNEFWGCSMPPPPSGTAAQPTQILGGCAYGTYSCNPVIGYPYKNDNLTQIYGGFNVGAVLYLSGSQYVKIEGLEFTSHNGTCTRVGYPQYPSGCSTSSPVGDFADWGIITTNTTSNITLQDVYIHGLTTEGIGGPIGGPFTLNRVSIDFNAFAGWNFDDGSATPDAAGSTITQSFVTMVGNGCLEQYPIANQQYPALACWDSNDGGFGDSWSGQTTELDGFSCDQCLIAYNAKDAAMGPHTLIKNLTITNSSFYGNMGQQGKWGTTQNNTTLFQNNTYIGNCQRMSEQLPGAAQNFNLSTGLPGSYLSNYCRAAGDLFDYFADLGSTVHFYGNTFVGYNATILNLGFATAGQGASTPYYFSDNVFLGYTTSTSNYPNTGESPGLFYLGDPSVAIVSSSNDEFGVRNSNCDGTFAGTHALCSDPSLVSEPAQGAWPPETVFDNFNFHPSSTSPLIGAGTPESGMTTDYYGVTRPNPPSIGAVEPASE